MASRHPMAVLLVALLGCAGSSTDPLPNGLRVSFTAPTVVQLGDSAVLQLALYNDTGADIPLSLFAEGGFAFDPVVRLLGDSSIVWERISNLVLASGALERQMHPGDSAMFRAVWHLNGTAGLPVRTGIYLVTPFLKDEAGNPIVDQRFARQLRVVSR